MNLPYLNLNEDQWLLRSAANKTSLDGEDGILEKVFEVLPPENPWCVEFGAWDGKEYSNSYTLLKEKGWSGVLIEADPRRYADLVVNFGSNPKVNCLNAFVTFEGPNALRNLLDGTGIPQDFDLLSIDIDGADYHIWSTFEKYTPKVVVIEFNPTIPDHVEFVQPRDMRINQGSSLLSLVKLGSSKGYELICITEHNAIFVLRDLYHKFNIRDNSIRSLHPHSFAQFHIFQLYDGTFVVGGRDRMVWQNGLPIRQTKFQVVPGFLRTYPLWDANPAKTLVRRIWRYLYCRGLI